MNKKGSKRDQIKGVKKELNRLLSLSTIREKEDYKTIADLSAKIADYERESDKDWGSNDTSELEALFSEYGSLRQEILNTINNRTQIMLLGIAAIGALVGGSLLIAQPNENKIAIYAIFSAAVPLVCAYVLLVWVSEAMRCNRVGHFLATEVEARINAKLGRLVLTRETYLWSGLMPREELFGPSMLAMAIMGVIALFSPIFGMFLSNTSWKPIHQPLLVLGLPYIFLLLIAGYIIIKRKRLKRNQLGA